MAASTAIDFEHDANTAEGSEPQDAREPLVSRQILYALMAIQGLSAAFFLADLWSEVFGLRTWQIPFEVHEVIQIGASIGLLAGMLTTAFVLSQSMQRVTNLTRQVNVATGQFHEHLETLFTEWDLSKSERAVAVYAMKGFSNVEVADFRGTSVATVKTQLKAVYRKSGCANRQQLMSYLVEELLAGVKAE